MILSKFPYIQLHYDFLSSLLSISKTKQKQYYHEALKQGKSFEESVFEMMKKCNLYITSSLSSLDKESCPNLQESTFSNFMQGCLKYLKKYLSLNNCHIDGMLIKDIMKKVFDDEYISGSWKIKINLFITIS